MANPLAIEKPFWKVKDLTRVEGDGEFTCPRCGAMISPDDKTEKTYEILKTVMKEETLEKIIVRCNNCGSQIHLTGFLLLKK